MSPALSPANIARLRAATPGTASIIHFNHAGSSLPSAATLQAVIDHLQREAHRGPIEAAQAALPLVEAARKRAAQLLNADSSEIAFAAACSDAWGRAFASLGPWRAGDRILLGRHEWGGNLATMQQIAARAGASLEVIPCDDHGRVSPEALAAMVDERVRLISLTWLPANGGLINPAAEIGAVARRHGIPYLIDAAQAVGQLPVDVQALGCDFLVAPVRKHLRGPRGLSLLYVSRARAAQLQPAWFDAASAPVGADGQSARRSDARQLEQSDQPMAALCGLANALEEALNLGVDNIRACVAQAADDLRGRLAIMSGVRLHDLGEEHSGLVSFDVEGKSGAEVKQWLAGKGINVAVNGVPYTPLDMRVRQLTEVVRASVSYLTSTEELDALEQALLEIAP